MGAGQQALLSVGAAGAPAFSPADIAGLTFWAKADAITGKVDNDLLDQWDDSSGNAFHGTASGGLRATYKTNVQNGLPGVLFSGAQYFTGTTRNNLINNNNYAIFVVARLPDLSLAVSQFFVADLGSRLILYSDSSGHLSARHSTGLTFDVDAGAGTDDQTFILDVRHDEAAAGTARHQVKRSGGSVVGNSAIGAFTSTGGTDAVYFGGRSGISRFVTGYIFEIIIYNSVVSDADRTSLRNHLATKWGFVYS